MLVLVLALIAAVEVAIDGSQECRSHSYVTIQSTYQVSEACRPLDMSTNRSSPLETLGSFVRTYCNTTWKGCTVRDYGEIYLELRVECSYTRKDDRTCLRRANNDNKKLQDALRREFPVLRVTGYNLKLSEDCGTATPTPQNITTQATALTENTVITTRVTTPTPCPICEKTVTGKHGGFDSSGANPEEKCRYSVCSSHGSSRYLLLGFYQAPQLVPATIQEGGCSEDGQRILKKCLDDDKPCLTVVNNSCACVRFTTPRCLSVGGLQGRFVAFEIEYLDPVTFIIGLSEAIEIAKKPHLWPKLAEFFANPKSKFSLLSKDPDFKALFASIPLKYIILFL